MRWLIDNGILLSFNHDELKIYFFYHSIKAGDANSEATFYRIYRKAQRSGEFPCANITPIVPWEHNGTFSKYLNSCTL